MYNQGTGILEGREVDWTQYFIPNNFYQGRFAAINIPYLLGVKVINNYDF